jgi:hypothetical protein
MTIRGGTMRRRTIGRGLALAGIATLALAVTASAEPGGNGKGKAKGHDKVKVAKQCAKEKKALGKDAFRELYGKPAMKNCKALGDDGVGVEEKVNAAKECKAEQADPAFADAHEGKTFDEFYGTNGNKKNAFGKCVSMKAKEKEQEQPTATR